MERPLLITSIMKHAELQHPNREIVSVTVDDPCHRYTYRECFARVRRLANAFGRAGLQSGDRIATLAWNDYRHFEIYYASACAGHVCHTINPRLFENQISYIIKHAQDKWLFADPVFAPLLASLESSLGGVERIVFLTDDARMPKHSLKRAVSYESLISEESEEFDWPELDENTASSLCYTSGTTGNPKGVLYSHRSTVLHAYASTLADVMGLGSRDVVLPVVPMFHANAWGIPYAVPMVGAKLVFPGPKMGDAETLHALIENEGVTFSAAVPTVWLGLLGYLDQNRKGVGRLERVVCGGSAVPLSLMKAFSERYGVEVQQAWGMTETSPLGTFSALKPETAGLSGDEYDAVRVKQGLAVFGVEMKITDDEGRELPWDGKTFGTLKVRGPWVCSGYFKLDESPAHEADGWFATGDVATIDSDGYMQITDRTKDVIKSGGEWISSIELENTAVGHPAVAEAAVIGVRDDKWG